MNVALRNIPLCVQRDSHQSNEMGNKLYKLASDVNWHQSAATNIPALTCMS